MVVRIGLSSSNQLIEVLAVPVKELLVVAHRETHLQTVLHVTIEVNEVRIDVVQQRLLRLQSQNNRKPAAERFDISTLRVRFPNRL